MTKCRLWRQFLFEVDYGLDKRGQKGYICLNKNIYEFLELEERDTEESYCNLEKIQDDTYKFIAQYYNGGCSLDEILEDEMRKNG